MTYQEALDLINEYIVTNGNNEITATVLNPILEAMVGACSDTTGALANLSTTDKTNLVAAINELFGVVDGFENSGVQLHTGTANPNVTPPASYGIADFYIQVDGDNDPLQLFQWDGSIWVTPLADAPGDGETYGRKDGEWVVVEATGGIQSIVAGDNITVDATDPDNPIVSSTGGGAIDQDNIFRLKKTDYVDAVTATNLAAVVNACPLFTIGEKEIFIFFAVWIDTTLADATAKEIKFILRDKGKGTYGSGGANTVSAANIEIIYVSSPILSDITVQPDTQTIDLGEIGATPVHEALNAQDPAITIQAQADGYVIVETLVSSVVTNYLFSGAGGDYGLGEEQSTEDEFHLFGDSLVEGPTIPYSGTGGNLITGNLEFAGDMGLVNVAGLFMQFFAFGDEAMVFGIDNDGTATQLSIGDGNILVSSSNATFPGLTYAADYSASYTNRSLVDKEYVDSVAGGGGGAVDSVNSQTGVVVLDQDDILDGTTYKQYSATEKTKLAGIATGATAYTDALAKAAAVANTITDGVTDVAPSQNAVFDALAFTVKRIIPRLAPSATHTGTTADTVVQTYEIPANTVDDNAALELEIHVSKINTVSGGWDLRVSLNDTPDLSGTPELLGRLTTASSATVQASTLRRQMWISGSTIYVRDKDIAFGSDFGSFNTANDTATWNRAATKYLIIHLEMAGSTQQAVVDSVSFIQK